MAKQNIHRILTCLTLIFCLSSFSSINGKASEESLSTCQTKEGYTCALSEDILDQLISYSIDKDYEAIQKLMDANLVIVMKKDVKVFLVDTHIFKGKVEFRLPGETTILWTVTEALKC